MTNHIEEARKIAGEWNLIDAIAAAIAAAEERGRMEERERCASKAAGVWVKTIPPSTHLEGPQPCGISEPSTRDCQNMKEVGGGMDGERYRCDVCGKSYFLDYEEMK